MSLPPQKRRGTYALSTWILLGPLSISASADFLGVVTTDKSADLPICQTISPNVPEPLRICNVFTEFSPPAGDCTVNADCTIGQKCAAGSCADNLLAVSFSNITFGVSGTATVFFNTGTPPDDVQPITFTCFDDPCIQAPAPQPVGLKAKKARILGYSRNSCVRPIPGFPLRRVETNLARLSIFNPKRRPS